MWTPGLFPDNLFVGAALMFLAMGCLGMGNGSVFQLVPLRFPKEIGVMTGIVGAAGGVGGFFLPSVLGFLKKQTDSFSGGFFAFAATAFICAIALALVSRSWEGVFVGRGGKAVSEVEPILEPAPALAQPVEVMACGNY